MVNVLLQKVLCSKIHSQVSCTLLVLAVLIKYIFQNLVQHVVYESATGSRSEPVYSDLQLELILFQFDTVLTAVVYKAVQKLEIEP